MFRSIIPVFLSSLENQNLCVLTAGLFRGPRLMVDGKVREPAGKYYFLPDKDKKFVKLRLRRRFLDPIPDIEVAGQIVEITAPFRWYEQLWMSLAGSLMYLHFGLGLVIGLLAYSLNTRVFRSYQHGGLKYLFSGLITLGGVTLFLAAIYGSLVAMNAIRVSRLESSLNAEGLGEIHRAHEPPGRDSLGTMDGFGYPRHHVDREYLLNLLTSGQYSQLNSELQLLQDGYARDFRNEQLLAEGYATFGMSDSSAEGYFNQWVSRFPRSYVPYLARATYSGERANRMEGDEKEIQSDASIDDIRTALSIEPRLLVAYRLLIEGARTRGDHLAETLYATKAFQLCPLSFLIRESHVRALLPRWGGSYYAVNAFVRASMAFARLNPKFSLLRGYVDWDKGRTAEAGKDYTNAIRLYTTALQYGESALFLYERGTAYLSQKQYAPAYADLMKARDAEPSNPRVLTSLGGACYGLGRSGDASEYLHKASMLDACSPGIAEWRSWIGKDLIRRGDERLQARDFEQAVEFFNKAVEFDPDNAEVYYYRAATNASLGRIVQATNDALNAIRMNPRHFASYQLLGQIYATRRDWDAMISSWSKFIALQPDIAGAYLERAAAYAQKGDADAALRDAKKACLLGEDKGCVIADRIQSGSP